MNTIRVLFLGDLVGITGRTMLEKHLPMLVQKHSIDSVIVNGENCSKQGRGITPKEMAFFKELGVSVVTSGNHIWHKRDIYPYLMQNTDLLRPANYPHGAPGVGVTTFNCKGNLVAVVNLIGRVFMREDVECPFRAAESIITYLRDKTNIIFVDFHAEATSEKKGLAYHLDGKISGLVGTHTHVPTCDEQILPGGTAYLTDLGMGGAVNSMLGMQKEAIIKRFITQLPTQFVVATEGPGIMTGAWIEVDTNTGKPTKIERVRVDDPNLQVDSKIK